MSALSTSSCVRMADVLIPTLMRAICVNVGLALSTMRSARDVMVSKTN